MSLEVVAAGILTTVQDRGRPGWASIGVPRSGFVDHELAAVVNRIVGNDPDVALLETVGGLAVRALAPIVAASDTEPVAQTLPAGATFRIAAGERQWHYLAVRGGVDVDLVLGSRSTDTLSGLGPAPLSAGSVVPLGPEPAAAPHGEVVPVRPHSRRARLFAGPRLDWFAPGTLDTVIGTEWRVTSSSRIGVRLHGVEVDRFVTRELPSEGLVRGAIQVPPDGDPIMMLADHPTTGGYPVIAVVHPDDVALVAQQRAGYTVRFTAAI